MIRKAAPPPEPVEPEKKERVIHTRVPESLEAELRERAQSLGISVSNLVRNVLGHAFGLVGDVVADSHAIARAARGDKVAEAAAAAAAQGPGAPAGTGVTSGTQVGGGFSTGYSVGTSAGTATASAASPPPAPFAGGIDDVLGWQAIVLGKNAVCAKCNDVLLRGTEAAAGIAESGPTRFLICLACLEAQRA